MVLTRSAVGIRLAGDERQTPSARRGAPLVAPAAPRAEGAEGAEGAERSMDRSVGDAGDAVGEAFDVEVDEEAHRTSREAKIREKLGAVERLDAIYGLELDNDTVIDQEIHPKAMGTSNALIHERQSALPLH